MYITWGLVSKWLLTEWCKFQRFRKCSFSLLLPNSCGWLMAWSKNVIYSLGLAKHPHMMLPNWIPPFFFPFLSNLGHLTSPCIEFCILSHLACNLWRSRKLDFGKLALTYQGILWGIWSSIPMFHTCKKTYPSILWAHQIWAWYLKPCQKKVGCQNYRGLPDTL